MNIIAKPAYSNRDQNPYNYELYRHLADLEECKVEEFTPMKALFGSYDIFHIHWPEVMIEGYGLLRTLFNIVSFRLLVTIMKWKGAAVVWTVHNLRSHDHGSRSVLLQRLEDAYMKAFADMVDGYITLTSEAGRLAAQKFPSLENVPGFVVPHGHYRNRYPNTSSREQARQHLGIEGSREVLSFFGKIRSYKNVPELARTFAKLQPDGKVLLVAGQVVDPGEREAIESVAESCDNIRLFFEFIAEEQVQYYFKASNLMVFPFSEVLNSGSVLLSLSFDVPVLVPEQGSMSELQEFFGRRWVKTYEGELETVDLQRALGELRNQDGASCEKIEEVGWDRIAEKTFRAYNEIKSPT